MKMKLRKAYRMAGRENYSVGYIEPTAISIGSYPAYVDGKLYKVPAWAQLVHCRIDDVRRKVDVYGLMVCGTWCRVCKD